VSSQYGKDLHSVCCQCVGVIIIIIIILFAPVNKKPSWCWQTCATLL